MSVTLKDSCPKLSVPEQIGACTQEAVFESVAP